jgi:hypothetical protein
MIKTGYRATIPLRPPATSVEGVSLWACYVHRNLATGVRGVSCEVAALYGREPPSMALYGRATPSMALYGRAIPSMILHCRACVTPATSQCGNRGFGGSVAK